MDDDPAFFWKKNACNFKTEKSSIKTQDTFLFVRLIYKD